MRLRISCMALWITVDADVAKAAGVPVDAADVPFTRARVLLEAQWLKNNLAAHDGLPVQKQGTKTNETTTMTNILMTQEDGDSSTNGGQSADAPTPLTPPPAAPEGSAAAEVPAESEQKA